jgi:GNAT superfamily N-acetyltransferase
MSAPARPGVRRAEVEDVSAVRDTLVSGFTDDPLYAWLYPDERERPARLGEVLDLLLHAALVQRCLWTLEDHLAAAIWTPAGVQLVDADVSDRYAALLRRQLGRRADDALAGMAACAEQTPTTPHDVLHNIAVHRRHQGTGLGAALLTPLIADCDRRRSPAALDSSSARNHSFYGRLGFRAHATVTVPGGGPTLTAMRRSPVG